MPERIETTYADLRPTDLVIDKAGNAWPIAELKLGTPIPEDDVEIMTVDFWLCDPVTKVKMHSMTKRIAHSVTVSRVPSQADEAAKLEAETAAALDSLEVNLLTGESRYTDLDGAVANIKSALDAEVVVEYTAEEYYAAEEANDDAPLRPPPFADMTPLEQRSHLYLLHGCYCNDTQSRDTLSTWHNELHSEKNAVKSKTIPHEHVPSKDANSRG